MAHKSPGKSAREGVSLMALADMFPTEESAREWFEARVWPNGRYCPKCPSGDFMSRMNRLSGGPS